MSNYSFNVFWSQPDQCYIALSPEFEDLSAFGSTPEEALAEMQTVLAMAIETYEEKGWALPESKPPPEYSGQFRVRLPKTLHAKLAAQAVFEGVSLNTLVVNLLSEGLGANRAATLTQETVEHLARQLSPPLPGTKKRR